MHEIQMFVFTVRLCGNTDSHTFITAALRFSNSRMEQLGPRAYGLQGLRYLFLLWPLSEVCQLLVLLTLRDG